MNPRTIRLLGALGVAVGVAALGSWLDAGAEDADAADADRPYSNIAAADYVGPQVCGECHEENYKLWQAHPHSRMNQDASGDTILGDFSGREIAYEGFADGPDRQVAGGRARFEKTGRDYTVSMFTPDGEFKRRFRITRTIGSRLQQMYVGIQTEGPEPKDHPIYSTELRVPFGFVLHQKRWFATPYTDHGYALEDPEDPIPQTVTPSLDVWDTNCSTCHNTYPYEMRLEVKTAYHPGYPRRDFKGDRAPVRLAEQRSGRATSSRSASAVSRATWAGASMRSTTRR